MSLQMLLAVGRTRSAQSIQSGQERGLWIRHATIDHTLAIAAARTIRLVWGGLVDQLPKGFDADALHSSGSKGLRRCSNHQRLSCKWEHVSACTRFALLITVTISFTTIRLPESSAMECIATLVRAPFSKCRDFACLHRAKCLHHRRILFPAFGTKRHFNRQTRTDDDKPQIRARVGAYVREAEPRNSLWANA